MRLALLLFVVALIGTEAQAQSRYEGLYGPTEDVALSDLLQNPEIYSGRAIRTRGYVEIDNSSGGSRQYVFRDVMGRVLLVPMPDIASTFESEGMSLMGRKLQVTGVFELQRQMNGPMMGLVGVLQFWAFDVEAPEKKGPIDARDVSLESLVRNPGKRDGETIRVVGQFRGRNLFGDLPSQSRRGSDDWVIKDDVYAVWISGKRPRGEGWALNPDIKREAGKWIEVTGRATTRGEITSIQAMRVRLTTAPPASSSPAVTAPVPERPKVPPSVVFALPLDGEPNVSPTTLFKVQFSKDMNEESFQGRVQLAYVDGLQPGDRPFDHLQCSYDAGKRVLIVDPGNALRPGRQVELQLLSGIVDIDGLELAPRQPSLPSGIAERLVFRVGEAAAVGGSST